MDIEAELATPGARIQLVHYHFAAPPNSTLRIEDKFRVELCLTARHRTARACFRDYWKPDRFERVGRAFIVPPANSLLARSDETASLTSLVCELDPARILALFDRVPAPTDRLLLASLDIRDDKVQSLLRRLAEEARHPGFASQTLVDAIAMQLCIELFRLGSTLSQPRQPGRLASWQLQLIDERLREVRAAPSLACLAELCGISVRTLTRNFPKSRGCTIGTYVANSQIEHAKQLLATEQSVTSIAETLGFSNCSNFCYAFQRAVGVPPRQYRQTVLRRHWTSRPAMN